MNGNAPCGRVFFGRVGWRIAGVLAAACAAAPALADLPPDAFTNEKLTAADTQRLMYDELVRKGVSREVAALATIETQIVRNEPDHLQFVQTMIGGIRREVDIRLTPGPARDAKRVPMTLDDGTVALAERVATKRVDKGFSTSGTVYLPKAEPTAALREYWRRQRTSPWWLELFGVNTANAQGGLAGMAISYGDSIVGSAGNAVGVQNLTVQGVVDVAKKVSSDPGVQDVQTVADVAQNIIDAIAPTPAVEGPKTLWQSRAETAGSVGKTLKYGYKAYKIYAKDAARRAKLQALEDCAKNPTNPLAKRAQREDPNYQRATTDAIADAERNLTLNTALNALAAITNTAAGEALKKSSPGGPGATMAKGVSYLGQVEGKLLDHVADEYIMKDAGKGVVPCEPDCGPVYSPAPPSAELASYTPAEWSGSSSGDGLVCEAAAPSSTSGQNFTPGPPPPPNPASQTCGILTSAAVTYRYEQQSGGCGTNFCQSRSEEAQLTGAVRLSVRNTRGQEGYVGSGTGQYSSSTTFDITSPLRCSSKTERGTSQGNADLVVNVMKSIDNNVVGGIDTSAMPADTSVVEVAFESHNLHQDNHWKNGCDPPDSFSDDEAGAGLGCYFYGVDLYRPGFYTVYVHNDPAGGICTLMLSK